MTFIWNFHYVQSIYPIIIGGLIHFLNLAFEIWKKSWILK